MVTLTQEEYCKILHTLRRAAGAIKELVTALDSINEQINTLKEDHNGEPANLVQD